MPAHSYSTVDLSQTQGTVDNNKMMLARSGSFSG